MMQAGTADKDQQYTKYGAQALQVLKPQLLFVCLLFCCKFALSKVYIIFPHLLGKVDCTHKQSLSEL